MNMKLVAAVLSMLSVPGLAFSQTALTTKPAQAPQSRQTASSPTTALVDVNHASADELDTLPGIGPARAAAIIKGRPYKGKNELVDKGVVPQNVYDGIKDKIVARQK